MKAIPVNHQESRGFATSLFVRDDYGLRYRSCVKAEKLALKKWLKATQKSYHSSKASSLLTNRRWLSIPGQAR